MSWLYYSDRLLEFPLGLFGIAIATVILPTLSRNHVSSDKKAFSANIDWAVKMVCVLGIPAAAGLAVLAQPLLIVIFQRGEFTPQDAVMASYSLTAYSAGLLSFMLVKVLAPGFFSRQDTKTPVKYGIWCMASNMVFNLIFAVPFGYVGLAIATTLSATMNAALLYAKLHELGVYRVSQATLYFLLKILISTVLMVISVLYLRPTIEVWLEWELADQVFQLAKLISISASVFLMSLLITGVRFDNLKGV